MFEFYTRRKLKRFIYSKPVLVLMLLPVFLMGSATWSAWAKEESTRGNLAAVESELEALRAREEALQKELERLDTPRGLEAEIRSKYELGREGEEMVVIVEEEKPVSKIVPIEPDPWWHFW